MIVRQWPLIGLGEKRRKGVGMGLEGGNGVLIRAWCVPVHHMYVTGFSSFSPYSSPVVY